MKDYDFFINHGFNCHCKNDDHYIMIDDIKNTVIIDITAPELYIFKNRFDTKTPLSSQYFIFNKSFNNEDELKDYIMFDFNNIYNEIGNTQAYKDCEVEMAKNSIIYSLEDYLESFSYSELYLKKSKDIDKDISDALDKLVSVYAKFESIDEFEKILLEKISSFSELKMLESSKDNMNCI